MENMKNKVSYNTGIILLIIVAFFVVFFQGLQTEKDRLTNLYKSGLEKIESQDYLGAKQDFMELGDYKDCLDYVTYCSALELYTSANYEAAISEFEKIKDFKDSSNYIVSGKRLIDQQVENQQLYENAYDFYTKGEYIQAVETFKKLNAYKDSDKLLEECEFILTQLQQAKTVSAGIRCSVSILNDGTVKYSGEDIKIKSEIEEWKDIVSVSAKGDLVIGLKRDGSVKVAGGLDEYYIDTSTWSDIIAVSAGEQYVVALREDGTLVAQGHNGDGQANIQDWKDIICVSTAWRRTVGLDSNGKIYMTGYRSKSQLAEIEKKQDEWVNIIAVSTGGGSDSWGEITEKGHTVGLRNDGTVVAVGDNTHGQCNVYNEEWSDIIAISAGDFHTVGLRADGTVVTTQTGDSAKEISEWTDIVAVSAGYGFTIGLKSNGEVVATGFDKNNQIKVDDWNNVMMYLNEWRTIFK